MGIGSIYSPPFVAGRHCLYQRAPGGSWCMRRVRQLCGGSETFLDMMWGNCFKLYNDATDKLSVFFVTYYFYTGIIKLNSPTVGIGGSNLKQCKSLVIFRDDLDVPCILCISFGVCYKIVTAAGFISYNRFFADPTSTLGDDDRRNRLGSSLKVLVMGRINPQKKKRLFFSRLVQNNDVFFCSFFSPRFFNKNMSSYCGYHWISYLEIIGFLWRDTKPLTPMHTASMAWMMNFLLLP